MAISKEDKDDLEVLRTKRGDKYADDLMALLEIEEAIKTPMPLADHLKLADKARKIIEKR